MYNKIKIKVYETVVNEQSTSRASKIFSSIIYASIFYMLLLFIIGTDTIIREKYNTFFTVSEILITIIFTIEYILRIWSCNIDSRYPGVVKGRFKYAIRPMQVFDLLAIVPLYLYYFTGIDARFLLLFRLFRVFRIFRLAGFQKSMSIMRNVIKSKRNEFILVLTLVIIGLFFASISIYLSERYAKPEWFGSVPKSMWWSFITMTTVGYGDTYPITATGKIIGTIVAFMGVLIIALPAGILSSGLSEEIQKGQKPQENTPIDLIQKLKERLVNGEINLEEYDQIFKAIK